MVASTRWMEVKGIAVFLLPYCSCFIICAPLLFLLHYLGSFLRVFGESGMAKGGGKKSANYVQSLR
jgi:hypothetical protein